MEENNDKNENISEKPQTQIGNIKNFKNINTDIDFTIYNVIKINKNE
jgi:hypothetical protein